MNREALIGKIAEALYDWECTPSSTGDYHDEAQAILTAITEAGMVVVPRELITEVRAFILEEIENREGGMFSTSNPYLKIPADLNRRLAAAEKGE